MILVVYVSLLGVFGQSLFQNEVNDCSNTNHLLLFEWTQICYMENHCCPLLVMELSLKTRYLITATYTSNNLY